MISYQWTLYIITFAQIYPCLLRLEKYSLIKDFGPIARFYDQLKYFVFGNALDEAASHFTYRIVPSETVLIIGGGSGEILRYLQQANHITFLDSSSRMIGLAMKRNSERTHFVLNDFLAFETKERFDWIVCPFFLDVFPEKELPRAIEKLGRLLKVNGRVLVTDFEPKNSRQRLLTFVMYLFFNLTTQIKHRKIPMIRQEFKNQGYSEMDQATFLGGFVFSSIFKL